MKTSGERTGADDELSSFPVEEISLSNSEFADVELSRYLSQEDIDRVGSLLSQSSASAPEDMLRADLDCQPHVSSADGFQEEFWASLERDENEPSLAIEAETEETGSVEVVVTPVGGLCQEAVHQYWHVARGKGVLSLHLQFEAVPAGSLEYRVRAVLFRKSAEFRRFPVNKVCSQHQEECGASGLGEHVVQARHDLEDEAVYSTEREGPRRSVSFLCQPPDEAGLLSRDISLVFRCNSSCDTTETSDPSYQRREAAQDLVLVLTLEHRNNIGETCKVVARTSIDVWPKQAINPRDLKKPKRLLPKGGKAKKRKFQDELSNFAEKIVADAKMKKFTLSQVLESVNRSWST